MATEPFLVTLDVPAVQRRHVMGPTVLSDYWALTKPEVNVLIAVATAAAFALGRPETLAQFPWMMLLHTVLGTVLAASGEAAQGEARRGAVCRLHVHGARQWDQHLYKHGIAGM